MNIYVGNLPYRVGEEDLANLFSEYGEVVSARIIMDKVSGRSKGFAFIEMTEQEDGEKAIEALNDSDLMGRNIKVNEARERSNDRDNDRNNDRRSFNTRRY